MSGAPKRARPLPTAIAAAIAAACAVAAPIVLKSEGKRNDAYLDPVRIVTICSGHTAGVKLGDHRSDSECASIMAADLAAHGQAIAPCIVRPIPVKTRGAFTSFAFNAGATAFCTSTMARKANAGDLAGACAELSRWVYAGGKELPGLVKRRAAERALCEAGVAEGLQAPQPQ